MDDTIARGEKDVEDFNYKEILSMFNIDKKHKYDDLISIIGEDNFFTTQMKKDIILQYNHLQLISIIHVILVL
jgi:hypothetical protein